MRKLIIFVSVALTWCAIQAAPANKTQDQTNPNKSKRGVIDQTHFYGDPSTIKYIYQDSASSAASNPTAPSYYPNSRTILYHNANPHTAASIKTQTEHEPPKVAVQQVLYEYQQTPHNAVSNVHVNQQFQTAPLAVHDQRAYTPDVVHSPTTFSHFVNQPHVLHVQPNQYSGVAAPVHHGAVINHGHYGQGYSKLLYGPFNAAQTTNAPLAQPKFIYANGKIVYHPILQSTPYQGVVLPARAHNLATNTLNPLNPLQQVRPTQQPFKPSPLIPITYSRYQTHPNATPRPTDAAAPAHVKEEAEEDESDERAEILEGHEEDDEDHAGYGAAEEEEEDEFRPSYFSKYRYEDDEDDHEGYQQEDEDEEDNTRSHTSYVRKNPKKFNKGSRYHKNDGYKAYKEGYKKNKKYLAEYKSPSERVKHESGSKKPKTQQYKTYKYYKSSSNSKPKKGEIEGRQSQNVPIVHNKKLVHQEKWLVTKKNGAE